MHRHSSEICLQLRFGKMHILFITSSLALTTLLLCAETLSPIYKAPRDASITGNYLVVLDRNTSREDFQQILARISQISGNNGVQSYVEHAGKVITVSLTPFSLELVSSIAIILLQRHARVAVTANCMNNIACAYVYVNLLRVCYHASGVASCWHNDWLYRLQRLWPLVCCITINSNNFNYGLILWTVYRFERLNSII